MIINLKNGVVYQERIYQHIGKHDDSQDEVCDVLRGELLLKDCL